MAASVQGHDRVTFITRNGNEPIVQRGDGGEVHPGPGARRPRRRRRARHPAGARPAGRHPLRQRRRPRRGRRRSDPVGGATGRPRRGADGPRRRGPARARARASPRWHYRARSIVSLGASP